MREKEGHMVVKEELSIEKSFEQRQKNLMDGAMQLLGEQSSGQREGQEQRL